MKYLKQLLADNNIKCNETCTKAQLLFLLFDAGKLTREDLFPSKKRQPNDSKYAHLHTIRTQPKKVTYTDTETGETITYNSIYKAIKATGRPAAFFLVRNRQDGKWMVAVE